MISIAIICIIPDENQILFYSSMSSDNYKIFFKVLCICYTEKAYLLEQIMLSRYETKKVALSHEVLDEIDVEHVLESVKHFVDYGRFEATFETEDELEKYNSTV
jgi:hypothetical protein